MAQNCPLFAHLKRILCSGILRNVLRYHVAYYLPKEDDKMVVAEVLDFPGVVSQGFDLSDARLMIASALEDVAQMHLEEGKPLPVPNLEATSSNADLVELVPLSVEVGASRS
jgi:predicted RNase H-like HicB family nuclease